MTFKEFLKLDEDGESGSDKGGMGFGVSYADTHGNSTERTAFVDKLKSTAGARPSQGGGGEGMNPMAAGGMFMKKKMKKKMKKS